MNRMNGQLKAYTFYKGNLVTLESIDKRASEIFKEIQRRTDVGSTEYSELVAKYMGLRALYKKYFQDALERDSSFLMITSS